MVYAYAATSVGQRRKENQDRFVCKTESVMAVIDGMGGLWRGKQCAEHVRRILDSIPPSADLARVFMRADVEVRKDAARHGKRTGCVVTACRMSSRNALQITHVGDSRAYLLCGSTRQLHQVTQDHTLVQETANRIGLTKQEVRQFHRRGAVTRGDKNVEISFEDETKLNSTNIVSRNIGGHLRLKVTDIQQTTVATSPGDILLLCSDGLFNMVSHRAIEIRVSSVRKPKDLKLIAHDLIRVANQRGGNDNITVLLALL